MGSEGEGDLLRRTIGAHLDVTGHLVGLHTLQKRVRSSATIKTEMLPNLWAKNQA